MTHGPTTIRHAGTVAALVLCSMVIYGWHATDAPLSAPEARLAAQGQSLADRRVHDTAGRALPVFIEEADGRWLPPLPVYGMALVDAMGLRSPHRARWVSITFASLDVALIYLVAMEVFAQPTLAVVAALLLLGNSAHSQYSRLAISDGVWELPFVLVWLLVVARRLASTDVPRPLLMGIGAAALTASLYAQPSAALLSPIVTLCGAALLLRRECLTRREILVSIAVAALVIAPAAIWLRRVPRAYSGTFWDWAISPTHPFNPIAALREGVNVPSLAASAQVYWDFFSPSHLFLLPSAPAFVAVFLLPMAVLIPMGLRQAARLGCSRRRDLAMLIAATFLAAPIAAAVYKEPRALERGLLIVPAGILLAIGAIEELWTMGGRVHRALLALLAIGSVGQFVWLLKSRSGL